MQLGSLEIELLANVARLRKDMEDAKRAVGDAMSEVRRHAELTSAAVNGALGMLRGLAAAVGVGWSVKGLVDAADAVTSLQNSLKLATGSARAAQQAYEQLFGIAQSSRTSFTELGATFASISRATSSLGLSQERLLGVTQAIGNAMTISGGSAAGMQAALQQLGQGLAAGALRGDELNSVLEQAPRLATALAEGLGVGVGELRKLGEAGSLTASQVIGALEKSAPQLAKEVQNATLTVGQAFTLLSNSAVRFVGDADAATGATKELAGAMRSMSGAMDEAAKLMREHEATFKIIGGALGGAAVAGSIVAVGSALKFVAGGVVALGAALAANPVVLTLLGIGAVVGGIAAARNTVAESASGMAFELKDLARRINEAQTQLDSVGDKSRNGAFAAGLINRIDEMKKERSKLQQALALQDVAGLDNRAEDSRIERGLEQMAKQAQATTEVAEIRSKLSGIDKDYLATIEKLSAARQAGVLGEREYIDMVSELARQTYKATDAQKEAEQAAKQNTERVNDLFNAVDAKVAAGVLELQQLHAHDAAQQSLTKAQQYALEVMEKLRTGELSLSAAQKVRLRTQLEQLDAAEREAAGLEAAQHAHETFVRATDATIAQTIAETVRQREANAELGLSADAVAALRAARVEALAVGAEELAQLFESMDPTSELAKQQLALAAAYRERAQAMRDGGAKQAELKAAEDSAKVWNGVFDQVGQSLSNALMDGGRSAGQQLQRYFKTLAVRMVVEAGIVQPLGNAMGLSSDSAGGSSAMGGLGNAASMYRTFGSANIGSAVSSVGSFLGSSSMSAYGAGMGMTSAQAAAAAEAYGAAGMGEIGASITAGSSMGGTLSTLGPYAAAAAVLYMAAKSLDDSGTPHTGGGAYADTYGSSLNRGVGFTLDAGDATAQGQAYALDTARTIAGMLNGIGRTVGAAGFGVATAFADDSSRDGAWGGLRITRDGKSVLDWQDTRTSRWAPREFADGDTGRQQYLQELARSTRDVLNGIGLPSWATKMLNALGDAPTLQQLGAAADQITHIEGVLTDLGKAFAQLSSLSGDAVTGLSDVFGSVDALASSAAAYYQSIYSDADKLAAVQKQVADVFVQLGQAVPRNAAEFKALVEAQDLNTASGRELYATLLKIAPTYADMRQQLDAVAQAAQQRVSDARSALASAYGTEAESLRAAIDAHRQFARSVRDFSSGLLVGSLSPLTPAQQYAQAREQFAQINALSQAGDETARGQLQSAAQAFLELSRSYNAGGNVYAADFDVVREALAQTAVHAEASASVAQLQLDGINRQLTLLGSIDASATTVATAMADLRGAVAAALQAGLGPGQLGALPSFDVGTNYVPTDMVARIHAGERIVPAADNAALIEALRNPPAAGSPALERLLEAVLAELQRLRDQNADGHAANVSATLSSAATIAAGVSDGVSRGAHAARLREGATIR